MNESIKFTEDAANGRYEKDDTGVMVAVVDTSFAGVVAVVRLTDDSYITAPIADIEYAGE